MDYVDGFVSALRRLDAPVFQVVRPGLTETQVVETVQAARPELVAAVDDGFVSWWAWQNGVDPERNAGVIAENDGFVIVNAIGPHGLGLAPLAELLSRGTDRMWTPDSHGGVPKSYLPIGSDDFGRIFGVTKEPSQPGGTPTWHVVWTTGDLDRWLPLEATADDYDRPGSAKVKPTSFADFLSLMTDEMDDGRMTVQPWGGVAPA